jgi:hypothetical protein
MILQAMQVIVLADFVSLSMVLIYSERSLFVNYKMQEKRLNARIREALPVLPDFLAFN